MPSKASGFISLFIIGSLFFVVGVCTVYFKGWPNYQDAKNSVNWPQSKGVVLSSKVIQNWDSSKKTRYYRFSVRYSYVVNGNQFQSSQVYMGDSGGSKSTDSKKAYKYARKYPTGRSIVVYYSPKDTENAVLEPGAKIDNYIFLGIGLLFGLVGTFMLLASLFKLTFLTVKGVAILGFFFTRRKKASYQPSSSAILRNKKGKKLTASNNVTGINLDSEMDQFNKVSLSSSPIYKKPWNYNWILEISGKKYGPYSFEKLLSYCKSGRVNEDCNCYPSKGGKSVKVGSIIHRKKKAG